MEKWKNWSNERWEHIMDFIALDAAGLILNYDSTWMDESTMDGSVCIIIFEKKCGTEEYGLQGELELLS